MRKIVLLAAALSLASPAIAAAEPGRAWKVGNRSYHLHLSDLDLRTAAGRAEALARAERAAEKLCTEGPPVRRRACVTGTLWNTTDGSAQAALRLAMDERASVRLAASR